MTDKRIAQQHHATFEGIRQNDASGAEFWLARDLAPLLDYPQWRNFVPVLEKARDACRNSGQPEADHFADIRKMVEIGSGALREVEDVRLSRYACSCPVRPELVEGLFEYWPVVRPFDELTAHHERSCARHERRKTHYALRQAQGERGPVRRERGLI